jgi:branched-chain amino acid transport system substrate-binding protein
MSGPAGEGTLFTFPTDPRRSPSAAKALEQFKAQGYDPEGFTLFSYGVVQAIADGVKRSGSDDPAKIAAALEDGKPVDTVMGPVKFDGKGDILDPRYDINMWSAGKYGPIAK